MITTPLEHYELNGIRVYVKREDLCGGADEPTFSKIRGVFAHLEKLKYKGITTVGYTETSISMAGWGVAWAAKKLGMTAVIFDPQYKNTPDVLAYHRSKWKMYDAVIEPVPAGMAKVNWYISKRILHEKYGKNAVLLPLGLPFKESIQATTKEVHIALNHQMPVIPKTIVVNIGSGTICAGILKAVYESPHDIRLIGIMGRTGDVHKKRQIIIDKSGLLLYAFPFDVFDPGWQYTEKSEIDCPFESHPYYDLKAWEWLSENVLNLSQPILFWNIGH